MVCRQAGERKTLPCCTRAKVPFASEPGMCFPSRALRHDPAIRGRDPAVFSLHRLTLCRFQPTVVAAEAAHVPPQMYSKNPDDRFSCFTLFLLKCLTDGGQLSTREYANCEALV